MKQSLEMSLFSSRFQWKCLHWVTWSFQSLHLHVELIDELIDFVHLFIHSFIYSLFIIHLHIYSFIYSFMHSFIHSFIHCPRQYSYNWFNSLLSECAILPQITQHSPVVWIFGQSWDLMPQYNSMQCRLKMYMESYLNHQQHVIKWCIYSMHSKQEWIRKKATVYTVKCNETAAMVYGVWSLWICMKGKCSLFSCDSNAIFIKDLLLWFTYWTVFLCCSQHLMVYRCIHLFIPW